MAYLVKNRPKIVWVIKTPGHDLLHSLKVDFIRFLWVFFNILVEAILFPNDLGIKKVKMKVEYF